MSSAKTKTTATRLDDIINYVESAKGLGYSLSENGNIKIHQKIDNKFLILSTSEVNEILSRIDSDGKSFIQVNFLSGIKILITDSLIGFKPVEIVGLDMGRLPKVVTTPDLGSVFEAIQEVLSSESSSEHEFEILKKVFQSILYGAEKAGILLPEEKNWISRLSTSKSRAAA